MGLVDVNSRTLFERDTIPVLGRLSAAILWGHRARSEATLRVDGPSQVAWFVWMCICETVVDMLLSICCCARTHIAVNR